MRLSTMLKQIIEECFADIRENNDPNEGKQVFGNIWAALAGKRARFNTDEIFCTWRSLSAQLAAIYNEWYGLRFTTDAFLRVRAPETRMGLYPGYDDAVMRIVRHPDCLGIFIVSHGPPPTLKHTVGVFCEVNLVTGEETYYQQPVKNGRLAGPSQHISLKEFETICYSMR